MKCEKCGAEIFEGDVFCGGCGKKVEIEQEKSEASVDDFSNENTVFDAYAGMAASDSENENENENEYENENENESFRQENEENTEVEIEAASENDFENDNTETERKKSKNIKVSINKKSAKKIILIAVAVIAVIAVCVAGIKAYNMSVLKKPIVISLSDYITDKFSVYEGMPITENDSKASDYYDDYDDDDEYGYYDEEDDIYYTYTYRNNLKFGITLPVFGYDGYGYVNEEDIYNVIDWDSFYSDLNNLISAKKEYEYLTYRDFFSGNDFSFEIDKTSSISNGDKLTVSVNPIKETYYYGDITVEVSGTDKIYVITGLKKVTTIDPFDYVDIYANGANHYATVYPMVDENLDEKVDGAKDISVKAYNENIVAVYSGDYIIAKIKYYLSDEINNASNGDKVEMYCSCDEYGTLINDYSLYIGITNKTYTVSKLGEYITKDFEMSDTDLEKFKNDTYNRLCDRFEGNSSYSDFMFSCAYLSDLKDKTDDSSNIKNILYVVYSYKYKNWNNKVETKYYCVIYRDIIALDDKVLFSNDYYYDYDYYDSPEELITEDSENINFRKL